LVNSTGGYKVVLISHHELHQEVEIRIIKKLPQLFITQLIDIKIFSGL